MTNHEKMKTLSAEEMAKVIRRLVEEWLLFCMNHESVENGLIEWLESEVKE